MNKKNEFQAVNDIRKKYYNDLKQQQCALNMQIRLAMQIHDIETKVRLEKELKELNEQVKYLGG